MSPSKRPRESSRTAFYFLQWVHYRLFTHKAGSISQKYLFWYVGSASLCATNKRGGHIPCGRCGAMFAFCSGEEKLRIEAGRYCEVARHAGRVTAY